MRNNQMYLYFDQIYFKNKDIIQNHRTQRMQVIYPWYLRLWHKIFKPKGFYKIKVIMFEDESK
jgi:hypothetical protein